MSLYLLMEQYKKSLKVDLNVQIFISKINWFQLKIKLLNETSKMSKE